ncbi:hypothetical protein V5O48_019009, partial [Marasmius crinis-equi]
MPSHRRRSSHANGFCRNPSDNKRANAISSPSFSGYQSDHLWDDQSSDSSGSEIPRPSNAFILFRSDFTKEFGVHLRGDQTSMRAGSAWRSLSTEQKKPYRDRARVLREQHKRSYPDFKYHKHIPGRRSARHGGQRASPSSPSRLPSTRRATSEYESSTFPTSMSDLHTSSLPPGDVTDASGFRSADHQLPLPSLFTAPGLLPIIPASGSKDELLYLLAGLYGLERDQQFGLKPQIYGLQSSSQEPSLIASSEQTEFAPCDVTEENLGFPWNELLSDSGVLPMSEGETK